MNGQTDIEEGLSNNWTLLSRPIVLSQVGEPLVVKFTAAYVPINVGAYGHDQTASAFSLQVFDKHGKQAGCLKAISIHWDWDEPASNTADITLYVSKQDITGGREYGSVITTEKHIEDAKYDKKD